MLIIRTQPLLELWHVSMPWKGLCKIFSMHSMELFGIALVLLGLALELLYVRPQLNTMVHGAGEKLFAGS